MFLGIGNPMIESARVDQSFDMFLTYSSTYHVDRSSDWSVGIDLETLIIDMRFKKVIDDKLELSLEVPVISHNAGFMDGFLEWYHDSFGFDDYGRSDRRNDDFLFKIRHNGNPVVEGEPGELAFGDVRIGGKGILYANDPIISLNGFIDIPTGDADRGYGNGSYDWGFSLLIDKTLGESFMVYTNVGYVVTDTYDAKEDIDMKDFMFGGLGAEWMYSPNVSLYAQLYVQGSAYEDIGVREIDDSVSILSFGGKYRMRKNLTLEFSFSEDPNTAGAPDFMVGFGTSYKY
jgi:hypothetical protein